MFALATTTQANPIDGIAAMLIVLGVLVIGVLMMISVRSKIAARNANKSTARQTLDQLRRYAGRTDDQDAASSHFLETTQQLMAQLDNKAERLEQLLAQADQRIADLQATSVRAPQQRTPAAQSHLIVEVSPQPVVDPLTQSVYELADAGADPVEIAQQIDEQIGKIELILALRRTAAHT